MNELESPVDEYSNLSIVPNADHGMSNIEKSLADKVRKQAAELSLVYRELDERDMRIQTLQKTAMGKVSSFGQSQMKSKNVKHGKKTVVDTAEVVKLREQVEKRNAEKKELECTIRRMESIVLQKMCLLSKNGTKTNTEQGIYIGILEEAVQIKAKELNVGGHAELLAVFVELKQKLEQKDQELIKKDQELVKKDTELHQALYEVERLEDVKNEPTIAKTTLDEKEAMVDYANTLTEKLKNKTQKVDELSVCMERLRMDNMNLSNELKELINKHGQSTMESQGLCKQKKNDAREIEQLKAKETKMNDLLCKRDSAIENLKSQIESMQTIQDDLVGTIKEKSLELQSTEESMTNMKQRCSLISHIQEERKEIGQEVGLLLSFLKENVHSATEPEIDPENVTGNIQQVARSMDEMYTRLIAAEAFGAKMKLIEDEIAATIDQCKQDKQQDNFDLDTGMLFLQLIAESSEVHASIPYFQKLSTQLYDTIMESQDKLPELESAWSLECHQLKQKSNHLQNTLTTTNVELTEHKDLVEELKNKYENELYQVETLVKRLDQVKVQQTAERKHAEGLSIKFSELQAAFETMKTKAEEFERQTRLGNEKYTKLDALFQQNRSTADATEQDNQALRLQVQDYKQQHSEINIKLEDNSNQLNALRQTECILRNEIADAAYLAEGQNNFCQKMEQTIARMETEQNELISMKSSLSSTVHKIQQSGEKALQKLETILPPNIANFEWILSNKCDVTYILQHLVQIIQVLYEHTHMRPSTAHQPKTTENGHGRTAKQVHPMTEIKHNNVHYASTGQSYTGSISAVDRLKSRYVVSARYQRPSLSQSAVSFTRQESNDKLLCNKLQSVQDTFSQLRSSVSY